MLEKLKQFGWGYILIALFLGGVGACFISFNNTLQILAVSIGVILIIYSVVFVLNSLIRKERDIKFGFKIGLSVVFLVSGTVTLIFGGQAISIITDIFCLLLIIDGAFKLQTAIFSARCNVKAWWILPIFPIAVIIGAFILSKINFAEDQMHILSTTLGIVIITDGVSNLIDAFFVYASKRKIDKKYEDLYNGETKEKEQQ